ncbi:MAG: hypothetical protein WAU91_07020, partial [Desulfatitalea sp.]
FMADGLMLWWEERKHDFPGVKRLFINMDNGPECSGRRSQFLQMRCALILPKQALFTELLLFLLAS